MERLMDRDWTVMKVDVMVDWLVIVMVLRKVDLSGYNLVVMKVILKADNWEKLMGAK